MFRNGTCAYYCILFLGRSGIEKAIATVSPLWHAYWRMKRSGFEKSILRQRRILRQ